tara:strand:- start:2953 stop:5133 length:2181 start_codon:yes stop_codon:yes gene_type:complete
MKSKLDQALLLFQEGQLNKAKEVCLEILKEKPNDPNIYNFYAIILINLRQIEEAIENWNKAIKINGNYIDAYYNRGNAFFELKKFDLAIESFDKAIQIKPDYAEAYNNRGNALHELQKMELSIESFDKAIQVKPDYVEAYYNRGNALKDLKKFHEAIKSYNKAIQVKSDYFYAYNNLGNTLIELNEIESAIKNLNKAIEIKPDFSESYYNRGNAFLKLNKIESAIESYNKAIKIDPEYAQAYKNLGHALVSLDNTQDAFNSYNKAIQIKPDLDYLLGQLFFVKNNLCDWSFFNENLEKLKDKIIKYKRATMPFSILSIYDLPSLQKISAETYIKSQYSKIDTLKPITKREPNKKIRIGYYSADFRKHAVSYLLANLFELHDKSKFELIGFSLNPDQSKDEMYKRISSAFNQFINVSLKSDKEIAQVSRDLKIDIAVDLMGFTKNNKFGIFIERCAPIQVSYLGYPSTTGSNAIDYIIGDKFLIPKESQKDYSEKIIYLPGSFMANDSTKKISSRFFKKEELGLPEEGFVFCSFNNYYKITPKIFDVWMRLLKKVKNSVLWLAEGNNIAISNLQREANQRGVDSNRLIFAKRTKLLADHLARHKAADLFIDTIPYNGHSTASDALWSGLPLLTLAGKSFASRVSASLLNALGLSELITYTEKEYEDLALKLANNPNQLKELKNKLEKNKLDKPLFDTKLFTNNIELAYVKIYKKYLQNLPFENIEIE